MGVGGDSNTEDQTTGVSERVGRDGKDVVRTLFACRASEVAPPPPSPVFSPSQGAQRLWPARHARRRSSVLMARAGVDHKLTSDDGSD